MKLSPDVRFRRCLHRLFRARPPTRVRAPRLAFRSLTRLVGRALQCSTIHCDIGRASACLAAPRAPPHSQQWPFSLRTGSHARFCSRARGAQHAPHGPSLRHRILLPLPSPLLNSVGAARRADRVPQPFWAGSLDYARLLAEALNEATRGRCRREKRPGSFLHPWRLCAVGRLGLSARLAIERNPNALSTVE